MLRAEQIAVSLRGRAILSNVTVDVPCGSVVAVLGPNGAGKSTLLRTLAGDIQPVRGRVTMAGRPLSQWTVRERARRRAVLPQESALTFPFTCVEVVLLGRTPHRPDAPTADERLADQLIARAALELVGLGARADEPYATLSGGQRQLVHFARVLSQIWEPPATGGRCLLLDEPTASLDLRYQHLVLSCARRLAAEGTAVLAILHDLNLAAQYADSLVLLRDGGVIAHGTPRQVLRPSLLGEVFGVPVTLLGPPDRPLVLPGPLPTMRSADAAARNDEALLSPITPT